MNFHLYFRLNPHLSLILSLHLKVDLNFHHYVFYFHKEKVKIILSPQRVGAYISGATLIFLTACSYFILNSTAPNPFSFYQRLDGNLKFIEFLAWPFHSFGSWVLRLTSFATELNYSPARWRSSCSYQCIRVHLPSRFPRPLSSASSFQTVFLCLRSKILGLWFWTCVIYRCSCTSHGLWSTSPTGINFLCKHTHPRRTGWGGVR